MFVLIFLRTYIRYKKFFYEQMFGIRPNSGEHMFAIRSLFGERSFAIRPNSGELLFYIFLYEHLFDKKFL